MRNAAAASVEPPARALPAAGLWILGLLAAVLFGTVLPDLWRVASLVLGITMAAALAGPGALLTLLILTAGLTLAPLTDNQRSLLTDLGGLNFEGLRLLAALLAFGWVAAMEGAAPRVPKRVAPYLLFLAFAACSLLWSSDRTDGARLLLKLCYPVAGFLLVARAGMAPKTLRSLVAWSAIVATAANGIAALFYRPDADPELAGRFAGFLGPNLLGHFCAITALAFYAWSREPGQRRYFLLFLLMLAQLVASGSRTALVSLGVGLLLFDLLQRRWRWMAGVAAVGVLTWLLVPTLGARTALPEGVNLSGRLVIWHDVWSSMVALQQPWGHGLGATAAFLAGRYDTIRHVHNEFLRLLAETGPLGLALFLASYAALIGWLWRRRLDPDSSMVLAGIAMFLASSMTENTFEYFAVFSLFVWIYMGLVVSRAVAGGREESHHRFR